MHSLELTKPDGRALTLYAREPIAAGAAGAEPVPRAATRAGAPALASVARRVGDLRRAPPGPHVPAAARVRPAGARRSTQRSRPSCRPATGTSPCSTTAFPSLGGHGRATPPALHVPTAPADGHCEVVVFTHDRDTSLGALPLDHIELLLQVWARPHAPPRRARRRPATSCRSRTAAPRSASTLHHPHGQIYAYPVVPPVPARMASRRASTSPSTAAACCETMIDAERRDGARLLYEGPHAVAFVPVCARYPYEVLGRADPRRWRSFARPRRRRSAPTWRAR